jgi:hypothetical protein
LLIKERLGLPPIGKLYARGAQGIRARFGVRQTEEDTGALLGLNDRNGNFGCWHKKRFKGFRDANIII